MASQKVAAAAVDWTRVYSSLGLGKQTVAGLQAFRKRHDEARRIVNSLKEQRTDVDLEFYRNTLKNKDVVNQAEKILREFKPVTYDVNTQIKAIDAFEGKAVEKAQAAAAKIDEELSDLQKTLTNIEQARPFEDLTIEDVAIARPEIAKTTDNMVSKGKFSVPGYREKFGDLSVM